MRTDQEWRIDIKTTSDHAEKLTEHITRHHTYDTPEVIVTPIIGGSAEYLSWIAAEASA